MKLMIFQFLGGLGLFLFGMKTMSDGLQKMAGKRLRRILELLSSNRIVASFVGLSITAIIQSSSATSVMVIGFANAGLMTLSQSIGIILGANVGTTVTAQLIAFKISDYALPALATGVALKFFSKKPRTRQFGEVILGFGLLFYGLTIMKDGIGPLKKTPEFVSFFTMFDASTITGILLCVGLGTLLTMIVQSSSATVGICMALAGQGLMDFQSSVAFILGDNIGTTITAQLATIGANFNSRRVAWAHTLFNVIGVLYVIPLFPFFIKGVGEFTAHVMGTGAPDLVVEGTRPNIARYIANAHTLFNIFNALVFLAIMPIFTRVVSFLVPDRTEKERRYISSLDFNYADIPALALEQAREEIFAMGLLAQTTYFDVTNCVHSMDSQKLEEWKEREETLNRLQREIVEFLIQVSQGSISVEQGKEISSLMRMTNNFERIGDSVENIAELIEEMMENDLRLSDDGLKDFETIRRKVGEMIRFVTDAINTPPPELMRKANKFENTINFMREEMRGNYLVRLRSGVCALDPGLVFTDMLAHFEKIGDYSFNIAQAIAGEK